MDMDHAGLKETIETCRSAGLRTVGAGGNLAEAAQPIYADVFGLRIAVLAIAEHEHSIATERRAGASPLEPMDNYDQIKEARERSDFVLAVLHGGNEYYPLPSPRMVRTCRFLVDAGAHAVVCHHIHVPSGIEIYHDAPIIYSTGNFLFDDPGTVAPEWFRGYLVSISIRPGGATDLRLIPYRQCLGGIDVRFMDEDESRGFLAEISRLSGIIGESDALLQQWSRFCASRRGDYVSQILALSRVERKLCKMSGIWPFWRMSRKRIPQLLDMFQCESHRDVCIEILASGRAE
jgi:poly-gamma-glutamate synthesis protein (capsule biosynthesis protein)